MKSDHYAKIVVDHCELCRSLATLPKEYHPQSSVDLPISPCKTFSADVVRRFRQKIFVLRETFSSFTITSLISGEDHVVLRSILIQTISQIRPNPQTTALVRVDNAPGFVALHKDVQLGKLNIILDDGRRHNPNKNPVIDKGIQELITEILKYTEEAGPVTAEILAIVTNQLNSRIRGRGLTSWEILYQRDHNSGAQLDIDDKTLATLQENTRLSNQISSAKHKAVGGNVVQPAKVVPGSLVYIKKDGDKTRGRDRYIVVSVSDNDCVLKKLLKSQIMQKEHHLKLTEIMLVTPNTECRVDYTHGLDSSDDDMCDHLDKPLNELSIVPSNPSPSGSNNSTHDSSVISSNASGSPSNLLTDAPNSLNSSRNLSSIHEHSVIDSNTSGGPAVAHELPENPSIELPLLSSSPTNVVHSERLDSELDATIPYAMSPHDLEGRPQRQRKKPSYLKDFVMSDSSGRR